MLRAVAVASPGTMKAAGTYIMLKAAIPSSKYSTPACRAVALVEFMSSLRGLVAGIRYGHSPEAQAKVLAGSAGDALGVAEEVVRIVLLLERRELVEDRPAICCLDPALPLLLSEVVDVHPAGREWAHRLEAVARPTHVQLIVQGVLPGAGDVEYERGVAVAGDR